MQSHFLMPLVILSWETFACVASWKLVLIINALPFDHCMLLNLSMEYMCKK